MMGGKKRQLIFLVLALSLSLIGSVSAGFSDSYMYKKSITINHSMVLENLIDFPLLVNIYDSDIKGFTLANGSDILFASNDNIRLSYQIELFNQTYNSTHAQLVAWIKVNISSSSDIIIWMYFNNSNATNQENATDVWNSGYKGIYHLKEASGNVNDSTLNAHQSSSVGGTPDYLQSGKIGNAINFNAASDENFNLGNVADFNFAENFSVSAWIKTNQSAASIGIFGKLNNQAIPYRGFAMQVSNGYVAFWLNGLQNVSTTLINNNNWHYLSAIRSGNILKLYVDCALKSTLNEPNSTSNANNFYIAAWGYGMGNGYDYSGLIDEVQLSNTARSEIWMNASYQNQNAPLSFYSIGGTQSNLGTGDVSVNFSSYEETPITNSPYVFGQEFRFNVTITGSNGTAWTEFNQENYSATNTSNVFSLFLQNLSAGTYNYKWWAYSNSTDNNLTSGSSRQYIIVQAGSSLDLKLNGTSSNITINQGDSIYLNCSRISGEGDIYLYNNGSLINQGIILGNLSVFNSVGNFNITCSYYSTQNYSGNSITYRVNVVEKDIQAPIINFIYPTLISGSVISDTFVEIFSSIVEPNLARLVWNWKNANHTIYGNLALGVNFENRSELGENDNTFFDISNNSNNGLCSGNSCPIFSSVGRFSLKNKNDNNLIFLERFNTDLGNWNVSSYGGFIQIAPKDYSTKLMLNDTSSASYISVSRDFLEPEGIWILEYDTMSNPGAVGVMELLDSSDNVIISVDLGTTANTILFSTDSSGSSNSTFNAGTYKQVILRIDKSASLVNAYISDDDATYGSLKPLGSSKAYSGNLVSKLRFRTDTIRNGTVYLDEIKIYKPLLAVIGDSITDGKPRWGTHPAYPTGRLSASSNETSSPNYKIGNLLCTNCWIANRAFGGTDTSGVNSKIQTSILDQNFSQVYISIGHNDIMNGVALSTMQSNFNSIIGKVQAFGINGSSIIIGNVFPSGYFNSQAKIDQKNSWNAWLLNRSQELGAVYADLNSALKDPSNENQIRPGLSDDGTHLYPTGNDILAQTVVNAIQNFDNSHGKKSVYFDGINDSIIFGNASSLNLNKMSLFAWIKFSDAGNYTILSKGNSYRLGIEDGKIFSQINNGINVRAITTGTYDDGIWHNIAFTYNGSLHSLYVDGVQKAANTSTGEIVSTSENLTIGSNGSGFFKGYADDVFIYNYSFSSSEINNLWNSELIKINNNYWKFYVNESNLLDGLYFYRIYGVDSSENENYSELRNITVSTDNSPPTINIIFPESKTYGYNNALPLNFSVHDNQSTIDSCWYSLDNTGNVSLPNCQNTSFNAIDGNHIIYLYANDSAGNLGFANRSFSVSTSIAIALVKPTDAYWLNHQNIEFNYTVETSSRVYNCSLWLNNGIWHLNQTNSSAINVSGGLNRFLLNLSDGNYLWNVLCRTNYTAFAFNNRSFSVDSILPLVSISYPENNSISSQNVSLSINYSVSELNLDACWYSLDNGKTNFSVSCQNGVNNIGLSYKNGSFNLSAYAIDLAGNIGMSRIYNWTIEHDSISPNMTMSEPTGAKNSRTGIPLKFSVGDNVDTLEELTCWYTVSYTSTGGFVSGLEYVPILCANTTFNVPSESDYTILLSAKDRSGNSNYSNSSFSVSIPVPPPSGGGGGRGGGGGGGAPPAKALNETKVSSLELENIGDVVMLPGEEKTLSLQIRNIGNIFLNKCKISANAGLEEWISSEAVKSINSGEIAEMLFTVHIPSQASGNETFKAKISCMEYQTEIPLNIVLLSPSVRIHLSEIALSSKDVLAVKYEIESDIPSFDMRFTVTDSNGDLVTQQPQTISLSSDKKKSGEIGLDIANAEKGLLKISAFKEGTTNPLVEEFFVYDGGRRITGFTLLGNLNTTSLYVALIVILFAVVSFFIIRRIIRLRRMQ